MAQWNRCHETGAVRTDRDLKLAVEQAATRTDVVKICARQTPASGEIGEVVKAAFMFKVKPGGLSGVVQAQHAEWIPDHDMFDPS